MNRAASISETTLIQPAFLCPWRSTVTPEQRREESKLALEHAWEWFSLHATQRLQSVYFFLVSTAFLSAAFVTAAKEKMFVVAGGVAVLGACIAYFFYRMERRIRTLIHAAEDAIGPLQGELADRLQLEGMRIVTHVEANRPGEWKYSKVFRYLYSATGAGFILGFIFVAWAAVNDTSAASAFNVIVQAVLGVILIFCGYEMLFGLQNLPNPDRVQVAARWALFTLGIAAILAGIAIVCHLVFARL
jgi:hypothetical protein